MVGRPSNTSLLVRITEHEDYKEMNGRMVVTFTKPSRGSYLYAEKWCNKIFLSEIYPERQSVGEFPGLKPSILQKPSSN